MRRVADESDAPNVPAIQLQPLDGPAVDLVIRLQAGQVVADRAPEFAEAGPETLQAARERVVDARPGHVAEAVGPAAADRAQTEETPVPQPELDGARLGRRHRRQAPPGHLSAVDRRSR